MDCGRRRRLAGGEAGGREARVIGPCNVRLVHGSLPSEEIEATAPYLLTFALVASECNRILAKNKFSSLLFKVLLVDGVS